MKFLDDKNVMKRVIFYANLKLSGEDNSLYYFDSKKMRDIMIKWKSVQKALMKTPINGARLSSPFGMRKHQLMVLIKCTGGQTLLHQWERLSWHQVMSDKSRMVWRWW